MGGRGVLKRKGVTFYRPIIFPAVGTIAIAGWKRNKKEAQKRKLTGGGLLYDDSASGPADRTEGNKKQWVINDDDFEIGPLVRSYCYLPVLRRTDTRTMLRCCLPFGLEHRWLISGQKQSCNNTAVCIYVCHGCDILGTSTKGKETEENLNNCIWWFDLARAERCACSHSFSILSLLYFSSSCWWNHYFLEFWWLQAVPNI